MFAGLEASGADFYSAAFGQSCPLEIKLSSSFANRIELGGANTVGVSST